MSSKAVDVQKQLMFQYDNPKAPIEKLLDPEKGRREHNAC
jgi:hypothetical protein